MNAIMRTARVGGWVAGLAALLGALGCGTSQPKGYYGPTETLAQVVDAVNQNSRAVGSLYADLEFEAYLREDKDKPAHFVNGNGYLHLLKPSDFYFAGQKPGLRLFEMGSTQDRYWLAVYPDVSTMWWGFYRDIERVSSKALPIRPDLVMEVVGVSDINTDLSAVPAPVMRFNNDEDCYMIVWNVKRPDRWFASKEVWYDRQTHLPTKILLFDESGRVLLRANLGQRMRDKDGQIVLEKYRRVNIPDVPEEKQPRIASEYRLFFPETFSTMTINLTSASLHNSKGQPKPGVIETLFPESPDVKQVIQLGSHAR